MGLWFFGVKVKQFQPSGRKSHGKQFPPSAGTTHLRHHPVRTASFNS